MGSILITGGTLLDGTGNDPRKADIVIENKRIIRVTEPGLSSSVGHKVVDATGCTVMPGLVESHAHLGFAATIDRPESPMGLPEHDQLLRALHAGQVLLDSGFTSAYSGGNRFPHHDVLLRNEFADRWFPGPRLRAASWEGSAKMLSGEDDDQPVGPEAAARFVNEMADLQVDIVKVSLSGESGSVPFTSRVLTFSEDEVGSIAAAARSRGVWLSAHAHAAEAVKRAVRHGFRVVYHATWADEEALDLMEAARSDIFVAPSPGINWANLHMENAPPSTEQEETVAQVKQVMPELRRRGVRVLPGGDYGFFWNPIGTNARDLSLFVDWFGFTPMEVLVAATKWGGELMDMPVGTVAEGYLADVLVVDGDPLEDLTILLDSARLKVIMKDGRLHRADAALVTD